MSQSVNEDYWEEQEPKQAAFLTEACYNHTPKDISARVIPGKELGKFGSF